MNRLKQIIEQIMKEEKPRNEFGAFFLYIFSVVYGFLLWLRRTLYKKGFAGSDKLSCVVVSVGNLTAGGSGKTPMAVYLAEFFSRNGYKVSIISRGYKGSFEKTGGIVSDGKTIFATPSEAGDEPYMMAKRTGLPVLCGRNRYASGLEALRIGSDIIILDDGFQHISLERDINILLMDWEKPVGNGFVMPRGLMRERISAASDADAVVMTRSLYPAIKHDNIKKQLKGKPVFYSRHSQYVSFSSIDSEYRYEYYQDPGETVFVVSGIADNSAFFESVKNSGLNVSGHLFFEDHHEYSQEDYEIIVDRAISLGSGMIVTTEKDFVKLSGFSENIPKNEPGWFVLGVNHDFGKNRKEFENWILGNVKAFIFKKGLKC